MPGLSKMDLRIPRLGLAAAVAVWERRGSSYLTERHEGDLQLDSRGLYVLNGLTCSMARRQSSPLKSGSEGSQMIPWTSRSGHLLTQSYSAAFAGLECAHCSSVEVLLVPRWVATRWCFVDS